MPGRRRASFRNPPARRDPWFRTGCCAVRPTGPDDPARGGFPHEPSDDRLPDPGGRQTDRVGARVHGVSTLGGGCRSHARPKAAAWVCRIRFARGAGGHWRRPWRLAASLATPASDVCFLPHLAARPSGHSTVPCDSDEESQPVPIAPNRPATRWWSARWSLAASVTRRSSRPCATFRARHSSRPIWPSSPTWTRAAADRRGPDDLATLHRGADGGGA